MRISASVYPGLVAGAMAGGLLRAAVLAAWPENLGGLSPGLLAINAAGSGLAGLALAFSEPGRRRQLSASTMIAITVGFCGALTTFSAFAVAMQPLAWSTAAGLACVSVACWLGSAALGLAIGRRLNPPLVRANQDAQ